MGKMNGTRAIMGIMAAASVAAASACLALPGLRAYGAEGRAASGAAGPADASKMERAVSMGASAIGKGDAVYLGNIGSYPTPYTVLAEDTQDFGDTGMLLQSSVALERDVFDEDGKDYGESSIRAYLNGPFYQSGFSPAERKAMGVMAKPAPAEGDGAGAGFVPLKGDHVALPDLAELANRTYGAQALPRERMNMKTPRQSVPWLLRNSEGGSVSTYGPGGVQGTAQKADYSYISPMVLLKPRAIAFTAAISAAQPEEFGPIGMAEGTAYRLVLEGGDGFSAKGMDRWEAAPGEAVRMSVSSIGTPGEGVRYGRISALLVGEDGGVAAYGPLSQKVAEGEVHARIPEGMPEGEYHLYVFAEDARSASKRGATDYCSNMSDIMVKVAAPAEARVKEPHKVNIAVEGSGTLKASATMAFEGDVVTLSATPGEGYQLAGWESAEVDPGSQDQFLMPDSDVTVTAVFEPKPVTSLGVSVRIEGEGSAWTTDENGAYKTTFERGEAVRVAWAAKDGHVLGDVRADNIVVSYTRSAEGSASFYMPDREVEVLLVFAEREKDPHHVALYITGEGSAWTTDEGGAPKMSFKAGDKVRIQFSSSTAEPKNVASDQASIVKAGNYYEFTMPDKDVSVDFKFDEGTRAFSVNVVTYGSGSAWAADVSGKKAQQFKKGDRVLIQAFSNVAELSYVESYDVGIYGQGTEYYFDMPAKNVTVYVGYSEERQHYVGISTSGHGSAWAEDAYGNARTSFKPGEEVYVRYSTSEDYVDMECGYGGVSEYGDSYWFTMPDQDVSMFLYFWSDTAPYGSY